MRSLQRRPYFIFSILVLAVIVPKPRGADKSPALVLAHEVERIAGKGELWPGFDPMAIPLAMYDGERTYLFRHPAPPEGFRLDARTRPIAYVFAGRHPAITANTSTDLGGIRTATVMLPPPDAGRSMANLAAVAIHEAFHVFQRKRHPAWQANEADLFAYPLDDAGLLTLRRVESEALRRALESASACWARRAMDVRTERFARMDSASVAYEHGTELYEGLANYIQGLAGDAPIDLAAGGFTAFDVRLRAYATGRAMAVLLDRFRLGWQSSLEANDRQSLDEMLRKALPAVTEASNCALSAAKADAIERSARDDVKHLADERFRARASFDKLPGRRIEVVAADGRPLWPQGFDPLNVDRVAGGLLHTRYVRIGNERGYVEALDDETADITALTEGVGPHPLFNGVRRVVIVVPSDSVVIESDGRVKVTAPGMGLSFEHASVRKSGGDVIVALDR